MDPKLTRRISQVWTMTPPHPSFGGPQAKAGEENRQPDDSSSGSRKKNAKRRGKCQGDRNRIAYRLNHPQTRRHLSVLLLTRDLDQG